MRTVAVATIEIHSRILKQSRLKFFFAEFENSKMFVLPALSQTELPHALRRVGLHYPMAGHSMTHSFASKTPSARKIAHLHHHPSHLSFAVLEQVTTFIRGGNLHC
jgi:hypothetical protein